MEQIKSQLTEMRLSGMAGALRSLQESRKIHELSFTDGLRILLQAKRDQGQSNRYARLVRNASFRYRASMEELNFDTSRGIDKNLILSPANGSYIRDAGSILITGTTGCGKSFIASALGDRACRQGYSVIYFGMRKLLSKLKIVRLEGVAVRFFEKLAKTDLLIIDDFAIGTMDRQRQLSFWEIIEDRQARKSTIISSQFPPANWFDLFSDETIADAFMERMIHTSHRKMGRV